MVSKMMAAGSPRGNGVLPGTELLGKIIPLVSRMVASQVMGKGISQEDSEKYERKYGGAFPLLALIPMIIKGVAAVAGAATAATNIANAVETARNNRAMEDIARRRGNGVNGVDTHVDKIVSKVNKILEKHPNQTNDITHEKEKILKYVKYLQGKGFSFYA